MTNKEILQASVLDIIFENRNKDYGAYALRKGYNVRLLTALGTGLSVTALFIIMSMMTRNTVPVAPSKAGENEIVIRSIEMPREKPKEPEAIKQTVKEKKATTKIARAKYTTPPKIVELVKDPVATIEDIRDKEISTVNDLGDPDDKKVKTVTPPATTTTGGGPLQSITEKDFIIDERDPEFPGGAEAMRKFLARYLATPEELEAGEKKVVRISFRVDKDGTVNSFEIVTSGGDEFDKEVVRVCKKMPRWTPAIQNGIQVPVSYVLPVTFIGVE